MAEIVFSNIVKKHGRTDIIVKSAGTWAQAGSDMTELSRRALIECGEDLPSTPHIATQFAHQMNTEYDHIIDLRNFSDPWGGPQEHYNIVCKELQKYCQTL